MKKKMSRNFLKIFLTAIEMKMGLWYNITRKALRCKSLGAAPPVHTHSRVIDGFTKMPLQASIFASWYNITRKALRCKIL